MRSLLWTPKEEYVKTTNMYRFMAYVNDSQKLTIKNYKELYDFSINNIELFWKLLWEFEEIIYSKPFDKVCSDLSLFPGCKWFTGCKTNYAQNLLRYKNSDRPAIIFRGEDKVRQVFSFKQVKEEVESVAKSLRSLGVGQGDRVCGYMPNLPQTVIAMLATAAVGAVWCSCATDIGSAAATDRLGQVSPKVLFTADGYYYKGRAFDVTQNVKEVAEGIPSLQKVVVAPYINASLEKIPFAVKWEDFKTRGEKEFAYEQVEASSPAVIMFSSGTTGKPKCMVQPVGGLLINQLKELALHHDMKESDVMLYITTCSWMMWNWQAAALACGSAIVLYDGNPSHPDTGAIWRVVEEEKVTVMGLSASYIHSLLSSGFSPKNAADLSALRSISQTGSALSEEGFKFVYREIKGDLHFNSIAGGTDINGCFASGNPLSPVYSSELQGAGLGMKIKCYDELGKAVCDKQGELVCEAPSPSMPLYFWNDESGEKYRAAYFSLFKGVWNHGDYVTFNSQTAGVTFYGRSDSVLKPSGVRIGTAEIYNQVEKIKGIKDSLAVGQNTADDMRVILFVELDQGVLLDEKLKTDIKTILRKNASPRHVPHLIVQAPQIPKTLNGKKVESAVTNIINKRAVTNRDALANPQSLDFYYDFLKCLDDGK